MDSHRDHDHHVFPGTQKLEAKRGNAEHYFGHLPDCCRTLDSIQTDMKKYLKEIEVASMILMLIGCICHRFCSWHWAIWVCIVGLLLWVVQLVYKAFHWKEYQRENKQNIVMMLIAIAILYMIIFSR
jgi:hypothetical protein